MFVEIASSYRKGFKKFAPYAPESDRKRWGSLPDDFRQEIIQGGEKYINYAYPVLPATKYMEFCRTGNRSNYEALYFNRRRILNTLILAECAEGGGRFLDDIVNGLMAICEESGWQIPAHNCYMWSQHYCLPDSTDPILDLFAAETGAQLAMAEYLLKEELDEICPFITKRIDREITDRILTPYLRNRFGWMGGWGRVNNWTPWITQNVLIALTSRENITDNDIHEVILQACRSLDYFVDGYGEDGCCDEGAGYYRAAGLCLFNAIEVLDAVMDNAFLDVYQKNKIKNIASYIMNVHVDDRYYINFADCSPIAGRAGVREFLFAKRTGNEDMMSWAAMDHKLDSARLQPMACNLFYRLQGIFHEEEIASYDTSKSPVKPDIWYESAGLMIARDDKFCLAVKAGCNNDSHNHNDTGSITLYRDNRPLLIDVGVETYSRKTFSPQRYEIWTMQSCYHNVLTFNDAVQLPGAEHKAEVSNVNFSDSCVSITMELAKAYPAGTVQSYLRKVEFVKGQRITVTDTFTPQIKGTYLTLMTLRKTEWKDGVLFIEGGGQIIFCGAGKAKTEEIILTDAKLKREWGDKIYRTCFYPDGCQFSFSIY
ncbi:MAG TPA: heparinase [Clostridiaceae bacterium]|nr:heparinase [Clostridiaceae bacterium]